MKLIEITTCEICPYRTNYVCTHEHNTGHIEVSMTNVADLCPLPEPQQWQLSRKSLAGIFYILAHDMRTDFVVESRAMDRLDMNKSYRHALMMMIEWAERNDMCVKSRLKHTLYLIDNPNEEL